MDFETLFNQFKQTLINSVNTQQATMRSCVVKINDIKRDMLQANREIEKVGQDCEKYFRFFQKTADACHLLAEANDDIINNIENVEDEDLFESYEEAELQDDTYNDIDFDEESLDGEDEEDGDFVDEDECLDFEDEDEEDGDYIEGTFNE